MSGYNGMRAVPVSVVEAPVTAIPWASVSGLGTDTLHPKTSPEEKRGAALTAAKKIVQRKEQSVKDEGALVVVAV
jgi:hypothetical protein